MKRFNEKKRKKVLLCETNEIIKLHFPIFYLETLACSFAGDLPRRKNFLHQNQLSY